MFEHRPGVYIIRNTASADPHDCYVGKARDMHLRTNEHLNQICWERNQNVRLREAVRAYGPLMFRIDLLEYCSCEYETWSRETHWVDKLRPNYNICATSRIKKMPERSFAPVRHVEDYPVPSVYYRGLLFSVPARQINDDAADFVSIVLPLLRPQEREVVESIMYERPRNPNWTPHYCALLWTTARRKFRMLARARNFLLDRYS